MADLGRGLITGSGGSVMSRRPGGTRLLCIGGEDHHLRIPFLLQLRRSGLEVAAAGTAEAAPFATAGIEYWPIHFKRHVSPSEDWATIRELHLLLARLQPHVVQSFDTKPNVLVPWAARGLAGIRIVRTINGLGWVYSSRSLLALALRPVQRALHRRAMDCGGATIFQNGRDKRYFEQAGLVSPDRAVLIPGSGIDIDQFDRAVSQGPTAAQLRRTLGLDDAEIVITVARMTRQKGIPSLLKAASIVHKARARARFVLVGPRESEGLLAVSDARIRRNARYVVATGPRSDVPALLRMADVFAFPTEYREGVPRALLEAGLAGLPLIATNMPGCDEIVRDGWSGRLVKPREPRELAAAIVDVLSDRPAARAMGARASHIVRAQFGLIATVARYCELYQRVLACNPILDVHLPGPQPDGVQNSCSI